MKAASSRSFPQTTWTSSTKTPSVRPPGSVAVVVLVVVVFVLAFAFLAVGIVDVILVVVRRHNDNLGGHFKRDEARVAGVGHGVGIIAGYAAHRLHALLRAFQKIELVLQEMVP